MKRSILNEVETLMAEASQATAKFSMLSGLACPSGCGACCENHDVHVTVLDCLPLAFDLVQRGEAREILDRILAEDSAICPFFFSHGSGRGRCTEYQLRPVLCRLFGFAAQLNRHGQAEMALCKKLQAHPEAETARHLAEQAPRYNDFGHRLLAIDPNYGTERLPIREAVKKALEKALLTEQFMSREANP